MTNDAKDRHVLAAAVASEAQAIVTLNTKDFPEAACEPFAVEIMDPDAFLLDLMNLAAKEVCGVLARQVAALRRPPITMTDLLERLAVTVPQFAERAGSNC
jgi:hypothetical protein